MAPFLFVAGTPSVREAATAWQYLGARSTPNCCGSSVANCAPLVAGGTPSFSNNTDNFGPAGTERVVEALRIRASHRGREGPLPTLSSLSSVELLSTGA